MRALLLLSSLLALPACTTSVASVPTVTAEEARDLVLADLDTLEARPTATHWRRAYRHFDQHLEPHLAPQARLDLEVAFAGLRRHVGEGAEDALVEAVASLRAELQPQD